MPDFNLGPSHACTYMCTHTREHTHMNSSFACGIKKHLKIHELPSNETIRVLGVGDPL